MMLSRLCKTSRFREKPIHTYGSTVTKKLPKFVTVNNSEKTSPAPPPVEPPPEPEKPRFNEFGIQMISRELFAQLFNQNPPEIKANNSLIEESLRVLKEHNLCTKQEPVPDVNIDMPKLTGANVIEHFYNIGKAQSDPYKKLTTDLIAFIPEMPTNWNFEAGWTRYGPDGVSRVDFPLEDALVFDVEVCVQESPLPVLATAASATAWYSWVSESLMACSSGCTIKPSYTTEHLIPLESTARMKGFKLSSQANRPKIVLGHNVSYDRARVKEQYWLERTGLRFLDTMSLHISVSGITSYQKAMLKAGIGSEELRQFSSLSNLSKVYELYCGKKLAKDERELFVSGTMVDVVNNFQSLMTYCARDVEATHAVSQKVFPLFLERFPHPVTLGGMLELQTAFIPINENWNKYLADSQQAYEDLDLEAKCLLTQRANEACELLHGNNYKRDLWLWDQDWTTKPLTLKKTPVKSAVGKKDLEKSIDYEEEENMVEVQRMYRKQQFSSILGKQNLLPAREPLLPGYPAWYKKLCTKPNTPTWVPLPELISTGMRIVPKLLQLTWKSMPLHYVKSHGWGYLVPQKTPISMDLEADFPLDVFQDYCTQIGCEMCSCPEVAVEEYDDFGEPYHSFCKKPRLPKNSSVFCRAEFEQNWGLIKLPHKDGGHLNVGNPLAKDYINKFSENELSGSSLQAKKIIEISRMLSYWRNNQERIKSQIVCWLSKSELPRGLRTGPAVGVILPQIIVCGTITRRAVEPTWMTVSNAIVERVGSELRGIVQAPSGYSLVGADVDSQELWIASLLGDAHTVGLHGATPLGWMTLNGRKVDGTDMHSVTAKAVGVSRSHAKVLNYARIYGAGQKFSERLLKQFNSEMSLSEANQKAAKMMLLTKGKKAYRLKDNVLPEVSERVYSKYAAKNLCWMYGSTLQDLFGSYEWSGGTESAMFNSLEQIASQPHPETPFLKSRLSRALEPFLDSDDQFTPTRVNWVVQSGAVDFLHLMLVSMRWFLGPKIRFCLSFHDEVRYLVPENQKYEAALALHLTNLLTRTFCVLSLGMTDLPMSVAFFSSVEVDKVLRKDSNDDNTTPSNPFGLSKGYGVPIGETLDIYKSIEKARGGVGLRMKTISSVRKSHS